MGAALEAVRLPAKAAAGRLGFAGELLAAILGGMAIGVFGAFLLVAFESDRAPANSTGSETARSTSADLSQPMRFSLDQEGVLHAQGTIEPGAAARLALELEAHGGEIRMLSLDSPGGSLTEAIAMGRQVRSRRLATGVADGAVCASSCPLLFAGGTERIAGQRAAIGVHQFYARPVPGLRGSIDALSDAQLVTARVSRHLAEMGVDPAAWLHALDTPPTELYYFSGQELAEYRLTTQQASLPVALLERLTRLFGTI